MTLDEKTLTSRRQFLKTTGTVAAASALAGFQPMAVHAAGNDLIQVALVGCGGRGSGAAMNALATSTGPIKLVAMADAFPDRLNASYTAISQAATKQVDVPEDRRFL